MKAPKPAIAVRSGRHPHEIALLVMSVVIGVLGLLFSQATSPALANQLPPLVLNFFFVGLILAGGISLFGALADSLTGLLVERVGMSVLAFFYAGYAAAILAYTGSRGLTTSLFVASMAVASLVRIFQIGRDLKTIKSWMREYATKKAVQGPQIVEEGS